MADKPSQPASGPATPPALEELVDQVANSSGETAAAEAPGAELGDLIAATLTPEDAQQAVAGPMPIEGDQALTGLYRPATGRGPPKVESHESAACRPPARLDSQEVVSVAGDDEGEKPTNMYLPAVKAELRLRAERVRRPLLARHRGSLLLSLAGTGIMVLIGVEPRPGPRQPAKPAASQHRLAARTTVVDGRDSGASVQDAGSPRATVAPTGGRLTFSRRGGRIVVPVQLAGPKGRVQRSMLFDTGATLTTLNRGSLKAMGVTVSNDAPIVAVHTAGGVIRRRLVVVEEIAVGGSRVAGGLAVAVCDRCAPGDLAGLLGLNYARHFRVIIDHEHGQLTLEPKDSLRGHIADIRPFVELSEAKSLRAGGHLVISVTVHNRSPRRLERLVVSAKRRGGAGTQINGSLATIAPGQRTRMTLRGRAGPRIGAYELTLDEAYW